MADPKQTHTQKKDRLFHAIALLALKGQFITVQEAFLEFLKSWLIFNTL
jgi:hypothetical protein